MGNRKEDALTCPNHMQSYGVFVDERPSSLFPNEVNVQMIIADGTHLLLKMKGSLSFLPIRRPSLQGINDEDMQHITLISPHGWYPYNTDSLSSMASTQICNISFSLTNDLRDILQLRQTNKKQAIIPEDLVLRWLIGIQTSR